MPTATKNATVTKVVSSTSASAPKSRESFEGKKPSKDSSSKEAVFTKIPSDQSNKAWGSLDDKLYDDSECEAGSVRVIKSQESPRNHPAPVFKVGENGKLSASIIPSPTASCISGLSVGSECRTWREKGAAVAEAGVTRGKSLLFNRVGTMHRPSILSYVRNNMVVAAQAGSNMWASCFNIRVEVDQKKQQALLSNRRFVNGVLQETPHWLQKLLESRRIAQILKGFALLTMVSAPMQFALEPTCERKGDRQVVAVLKALHVSCSWLYVFLSAGQLAALTNNLALMARGLTGVYCRIFVDVLAQIGLIAELVHLSEVPSTLPTTAQGFMLLGTLKAWRVFFPTQHLSKVLQTFTVQVVQLFFWLVLAAHTSACFFLAMAIYEADSGKKTWMDKIFKKSEEQNCLDLYSAAVYFCTYTLTSIGYGDLVPVNAMEHVACVVFMLASQMFAAKIFADLTWITTTHGHWKAQYHARLTQTAAALDSMGVHPVLRHRVMAYQDFIEEEQRERRAQEMLHDLSQPLREELKLVVYYDLVVKAPFLQEQPTWVVRTIISSLADVVFLPADVIIRMGDMGTELYFLRNGRAAVYKTESMPDWNGDAVFVLKNGAYFGEVALLTGQPRTSWIIARTYCICSILPKQVIDTLMETRPHCIASLVSSLKNALHLKPSVSWPQCALRIRNEFSTSQQIFDFACSGDDGEAPAGLLTWHRFDMLMQRLQISTLDRKLLWVDLDVDCTGVVMFKDFLNLLSMHKPKNESGETGDKADVSKEGEDGLLDDEDDDVDEQEEAETGSCGLHFASAGTGEERQQGTRRGSNKSAKSRKSEDSTGKQSNISQNISPAWSTSSAAPRNKKRGSAKERRRIDELHPKAYADPQAIMDAMKHRLEQVTQQVFALTSHLGCKAQEGEAEEAG